MDKWLELSASYAWIKASHLTPLSISVQVLDVSSSKVKCTLPKPKTRCLQFSPQGTYLALWEPYAGKYLYSFFLTTLLLSIPLHLPPTPPLSLTHTLTFPILFSLSSPLPFSLPLSLSPPSSKGPSWRTQSHSLGHSVIRDGSGADTEETEWMVWTPTTKNIPFKIYQPS